jgi:hypothetical protein
MAAEGLVARINAEMVNGPTTELERGFLAEALQKWLIEEVRVYLLAHPLSTVVWQGSLPSHAVAAALDSSRFPDTVARHLIAAKLALRFRDLDLKVEDRPASDTYRQRPWLGDFLIGNTVFHVTVAPTQSVIDKCRENVRNGYRAQLLVRDSVLQAARQMVTMASLERQVGVSSIEAFVGQNIEEMGTFDQTAIMRTLSQLFAEYNRRVAEIEPDRSLLLDIPEFLR